MNIAVITGASSGIGMEFALQLDLHFHNLDEIWLIARRKEKLEEVRKLISTKTRIIKMDVTKEFDLGAYQILLEEKQPVIRMMVNCAGYGIMGDFAGSDLSLQSGMIKTNCEALVRMTYLSIPYMRKNSRIIQLASSAAFLPQPGFAIYAATKSFVLSFSRALQQELKKKQIYVTAVCPGPVDTPFFDVAEQGESIMLVKKYTMVLPYQVVKEALKASYERKDISVCSLPIKAFHVMSKLLPHELILKYYYGIVRK